MTQNEEGSYIESNSYMKLAYMHVHVCSPVKLYRCERSYPKIRNHMWTLMELSHNRPFAKLQKFLFSNPFLTFPEPLTPASLVYYHYL